MPRLHPRRVALQDGGPWRAIRSGYDARMRVWLGILILGAAFGCARNETAPVDRPGSSATVTTASDESESEPGARVVSLPSEAPPYVRPHIEARAEGESAPMANFRERLAAWRIADHELEGAGAPPFPPPLDARSSDASPDGPGGTRPPPGSSGEVSEPETLGTDLGELLKDLGAELEEEE